MYLLLNLFTQFIKTNSFILIERNYYT